LLVLGLARDKRACVETVAKSIKRRISIPRTKMNSSENAMTAAGAITRPAASLALGFWRGDVNDALRRRFGKPINNSSNS